MIVYATSEDWPSVRYYKHTNDGRPIFAGKREAVSLDGEKLEQVVRHLQIMRASIKIGTIAAGARFKREVDSEGQT